MKKVLTVLVTSCVALLTILNGQIFADDMDNGNYLLKICNSAMKTMQEPKELDVEWPELINSAECRSYVNGYANAIEFENKNNNLKVKYICFPDKAGLQLWRDVYKYLQDHPQELRYPKSLLVHKAFKVYYPCK